MLRTIITTRNFFKHYAPQVVNWKHKIIGRNSKNSDLSFSEDDLKAIEKGFNKFTVHALRDIRAGKIQDDVENIQE